MRHRQSRWKTNGDGQGTLRWPPESAIDAPDAFVVLGSTIGATGEAIALAVIERVGVPEKAGETVGR